MDELDYQRQTFYDWRNANPAFRLAVEEARDTFRGVVADCVHDLQQTVHVLLDDCIRANHIPLSTRLRAAGLFLRYALPNPSRPAASAPSSCSRRHLPSSPSQGPSSPAPNPCSQPRSPFVRAARTIIAAIASPARKPVPPTASENG
ncbi:MAG: hypothetical protein U5J83_15825 [Bryobacterales bacterium]|nr:hypothetical protein [Bryobacterales bacterium]